MDLPKFPSTAGEFAELLLNSPFSSNHRFTVKEGDETALVIATDLLISKLIAVETIHFYATFKVVPQLFYQLFTIFIQYKGHAIPAVRGGLTKGHVPQGPKPSGSPTQDMKRKIIPSIEGIFDYWK